MESVAGQDLCQYCNMCCDGTIFPHTSLKPDEVHLFTFQSQLQPQPCEHQCNGCKIYDSRPSACKEYKCNVLKGYEKGQMSFNKAKELVDNVKNSDYNDFQEKKDNFLEWENDLDPS